MEYKRTIYEIIEIYPNILRHRIPLMQILMGASYFATYPFVLAGLLIKKGLSLFNKVEVSIGAEDNALVSYFDLETLEAIELDEDDVTITESIYYSFKESILIGEELEEEGYAVFENVGKKYRIKKRVESVFSNEEKEDEKKVVMAVPIIAIKIHNFFDILKLL